MPPAASARTPVQEAASGVAYPRFRSLAAQKWWVLAAAIIGGLAIWQGYGLRAGAIVPVDTVARGNLVETVVASGHVETPYRVENGSQMTGTVAQVPVREGQAVTAGQLLVVL
ncbi:MAG: biotin/lipoyl-binding protein, partial [Sandarakinorhabdus sp.]|nr:biotin/lipoyl-binding protein [Sandarakinorhabdus sp.]